VSSRLLPSILAALASHALKGFRLFQVLATFTRSRKPFSLAGLFFKNYILSSNFIQFDLNQNTEDGHHGFAVGGL
jgi:hypothetical protein